MATEEEVPVTKESLDEKLGELKIEEPEKTESPEEAKEAVLEELTESPPKLEHVETKDTTDPVTEPTTEDIVVKSDVPEAFAEELKSDHDIVPPAEETPTPTEETAAKETGPEEVETKPPSKISGFGDKISAKFHKIVGKD